MDDGGGAGYRCRPVTVTESRIVVRLLAEDPLVTCQAGEWIGGRGLRDGGGRGGFPGSFYTRGGPQHSLFFVAGTIQPIRGGHQDMVAFTRLLLERRVPPMSVHGRRELVTDLWTVLGRQWGRARQFRGRQQLLALTRDLDPALREPDVRQMTAADFDLYLPASVAMYREELGADPLAVASGGPFRNRVARSLARRRSWGVVRDGRVVFKADVAAESHRVAQVQGIWVDPAYRGRGLGGAGTAAVLSALRARGLTPTLVVNEDNESAMRMYRRLGMSEAADYATVLAD